MACYVLENLEDSIIHTESNIFEIIEIKNINRNLTKITKC